MFLESASAYEINVNRMKNLTQFYEGCGQEGPIKCIFLSEFHPVAGPKISCQVYNYSIIKYS